jgi:Tfp pilus tip-associated adhesin PilY1
LFISVNVFAAGNIYTSPVVTLDKDFNILVIWGTGNKTDPLAKTGTDRIFQVKDNDRSSTYTLSDLEDISSSTYANPPDGHGWYINLKAGEKILEDADVSEKKIYVASYVPATGTDPCNKAGSSYLYVLDYITGAGAFEDGSRSKYIGEGTATAVVSVNPDTDDSSDTDTKSKNDVYVSLSTELNDDKIHTERFTDPIKGGGGIAEKNLLYWRDMRI